MALNSVFEAAVELDAFLAEEKRFLAEERLSDQGDYVADDDSFASEERRLHESEEELRKTLDSIEDSNDDETDSDASLSCERLDAFTAESYESPELQVPSLQSVSPFGSPFSESSTSVTRINEDIFSPVLEAPITVARLHSPKESKRRQIRAYGLRRHVEGSFVDIEASLEQHSNKAGDSLALVMANALFGRSEYTVRFLFSTKQYKRTVQGTVSVLLTSGIMVADWAKGLPQGAVLVVLLPVLIAAIQAKLPHRTDETIIALVILGTHVVMLRLSTLAVV